MDLRLHLMSRIVPIALACLLVASLAVLLRSERELDGAARQSAQTAVGLVEARLLELSLGYQRASSADDLALILEPAQRPGQCLRYVEDDRAVIGNLCQGWNLDTGLAPGWFVALLSKVRGAEREIRQPVLIHGVRRGELTVVADGRHEAAQVWRELVSMLGLTTLTVIALCVLTWLTIDRALWPTRNLLATLEALERGELGAVRPLSGCASSIASAPASTGLPRACRQRSPSAPS